MVEMFPPSVFLLKSSLKSQHMKKIFLFILLFYAYKNGLQAQQIKRQTLASQGATKVATPFRVSWTAGGCPGCNTLKAAGKAFLRQGFQQPPDIHNNPSGCSVVANFTVISQPSQICGTSYDFEYSGKQIQGVSFFWDFGEGANPRNATSPNPVGISYATAGSKIVVLTVKQNTCGASSAQVITLNTNQIGFGATVDVTPNKCFNEKKGAINIQPIGGSGVKTFRWSNGETTPTISNISAGRYQVTVSDGNNCRFTLDTFVSQPASGLVLKDTVVLETCKDYKDGSIRLGISGGLKPYRFIWGNGITKPRLDSLSVGIYKVRILDSNDCKIDTAFDVKLRCRQVKDNGIYDVFTPNGDNVNETWVVKDIENYPKNETQVFNRWGQVVYSKKGYKNEWEGKTNGGDELPAAPYYYVIRLNDEKQTVLTGSITLVR
jgi:gliding motility-associated-like protein